MCVDECKEKLVMGTSLRDSQGAGIRIGKAGGRKENTEQASA